jgi:6-phosphogluconolactonase/glucosamine-6-phosphate isomerase/deaminase
MARMTLTPNALLQSRKIFLLYDGEEKHRAFVEAKKAGDSCRAPLHSFLNQDRVPVAVLRAVN